MLKLKGKQVYNKLSELVNPRHTAVLVIDMCNEPTHQKGYFANKGANLSAVAEIVKPIANFLRIAREVGVLVIHIQQSNLPGGRGDSPAWLRLKSIAYKLNEEDGIDDDYCVEGTWGAEIHPDLTPQKDDVVVKKQRASGFIGTNLDLVLRSNKIETVVVTGTSTYGCVLNTVMDASCYDYYVVVVEDLIAGPNASLHSSAMSIMRSRHDIFKKDEIIRIWKEK
jgi:nicotinamidase-related amidase